MQSPSGHPRFRAELSPEGLAESLILSQSFVTLAAPGIQPHQLSVCLLVPRFVRDRFPERVDGRPELPALLTKVGHLDEEGQVILPELPASVLRPLLVKIFR